MCIAVAVVVVVVVPVFIIFNSLLSLCSLVKDHGVIRSDSQDTAKMKT